MTTKENTRLAAGAESDCARNSTESPTLRHRVQLSAQFGCTFVGTLSPLRVDVHWHGKGNPSRIRGLALTRYRRARDAFLERMALESRTTWAVAETGTGYARLLGLATCEARGSA
jgi:hypothetical protein